MNFKDQLAKDLDDVFFNDTEFTDTATLNGSSLSVYFNEEDDVVFSKASDLDSDVSASIPSVTCKSSDVISAENGDEVIVNNITYFIIDIEPSSGGTRKIYLSEDQP